MPFQTNKTSKMRIPDGCKISLFPSGGSSFLDVGAIEGDFDATLEWEENEILLGNAEVDPAIKKMTVSGSFGLVNLDEEAIECLGNGMFERVVTAGTQILAAAFTDQSIVGFTAGVPVALAPLVTATGEIMKFNAAPVITSVTASTSGVLAANNDYTIIIDKDAYSGYSIVFNTSGTATVATSETVTIVWGNNTPAAYTTMYAGESSMVMSPYAMRIDHTDDNGDVDFQLDLYSVRTSTGGIAFSLKGVNSDGVDVIPVSFVAKCDTSKTNGRQLLALRTM